MRARPGREAGRLASGRLLGLYIGQGRHGTPARIVLYRANIERHRGNRSLADEIALVLRHEIGHHFGLDDRGLRAAGH